MPSELARRHRLVPLSLEDGALVVAMEDALDVFAIDEVVLRTGREVRTRVASRRDIEDAWRRYYGSGQRSIIDLVEEVTRALRSGDFDPSADLAPIVRLTNQIVFEGLDRDASDVHLEQRDGRVEVRFRVDGMLEPGPTLPVEVASAVAVRVKVMSGLNISERRRPQDGRIRFALSGRPVDLRVATMPTIHGENLVLRILKPDLARFDLESLGFLPDQLTRFRSAIEAPQGIVLVTGPTGSGKTTTLYAALRALPCGRLKVVTLEDPVEYEFQGVQQTNVHPEAGVTFANGLRALLRQDPDVILVGEIRDGDTAQLAIRAALTGHLVLATLHTHDAIGAIPRLRNMEIEPYLLATTFRAVVAQRLVRRVCEACSRWRDLSRRDLGTLGDAVPAGAEPLRFRVGRGCADCRGTGYRGRTSLFELFQPDEAIREAILGAGSPDELRRLAAREGMVSLREAGVRRILSGTTTPEEVLRVA